MREQLRHPRADAAVSLVLALTIFAFAAGSSSVLHQHHVQSARWVMLGVLLAVSALSALGQASRPVLIALPTLLAGAFLVLALGSALWSVGPRLTVHRGGSLAIMLLGAALLAYGSGGNRERVERLLYGVLGGAVAVAVAGLLVLAVDRADAAPGKADQLLSRFQGFGERPTTDAMLYALALPIGLLWVVRARTGAPRVAALVSFALLDVLLILSGSRGPQIGGVLALVFFALGLSRAGRLKLAGAIAATAVLAVVSVLAQTSGKNAPLPPIRPGQNIPVTDFLNPGEIAQELGHAGRGANNARSLFGTSGRRAAWDGALRQGDRRPVLGYGFGTEERVFENHYYGYEGELVSSSWIGLYLQLGLAGVLLLLAIGGSLVAATVKVVRPARRSAVALAAAGVVIAAVPLTFVESWIYAVGNVAAVPFWVCALLFGALAARASEPEEEPIVAG